MMEPTTKPTAGWRPDPWDDEPLDVRMLSQVIIHTVQEAVQSDLRRTEQRCPGFIELPINGEITKLADRIRETVQQFDEGCTRALAHYKAELIRLHSTATPVMMTVVCPKCGGVDSK